jgi:hypothetical protein
MAGVNTDQRLNLSNRWEGPQKTCRGFKPDPGNLAVRQCVQVRLVCSAGDKPAGAKVRRPVVWIAEWRATKTLKPIDKVSLGEITSHRAVTTVNANVASKSQIRGPSPLPKGEGSMGCRNLTDAASPPWRGESDSTVTRTYRVTGEALLVPVRNHRSKVDRITGSTGKSIEGERVADGSVVAVKRSNVRGARGPFCL